MKAWLAFYPGDSWALWTLALVGQATVLLLVACAASWMLRRRPAVRHALWLSALLGVIVAPLLTVVVRQSANSVDRVATTDVSESPPTIELVPRPTAPMSRMPAPIPDVVHVERQAEVGPSSSILDAQTVAAAPPASKSQPVESWWRTVASAESLRLGFVAATAVWGAGALLFLARLLSGLRAAERLRVGGEPCDDPRVLRLAAPAAEALRLRRRPAILLSSAATGPLFLGLRRPVVLLPVGLPETLDDAALAAVLRHEFAHAARRDTLVGFVEQFARAVWWAHPLVWRLCQELDRAREELCDNAALQAADRTAYAETLLAVATFRSGGDLPAAGYAFLGPKRSFEARIVNLLDRRRCMTTKASLGVRMGMALVVAAAATLGAWGTRGWASDAKEGNVAASTPQNELAHDAPTAADGAQAKQPDGLRPDEKSDPKSGPQPSEFEWDAARRYLSLVETNFNRAIAAEQQLRAVQAAYQVDTVTLDLVLDAIRRRSEAMIAYYESTRGIRRSVMEEKHHDSIDYECLIQELPHLKQGVDDSQRLLLWIAANRPEPTNVKRATEQLNLMRAQLQTHLAKIEESPFSAKDDRARGIYVCTYNVSDLVPNDTKLVPQLEVLKEVIASTVSPESWDEKGGPGSISLYATEGCLVISQTESGHAQVVALLEQIRALKDGNQSHAAPPGAMKR